MQKRFVLSNVFSRFVQVLLAVCAVWTCCSQAAVVAQFPLHQAYLESAPPQDETLQLLVDSSDRFLFSRHFRDVRVWSVASGKFLGRFLDDDNGDILASAISKRGTLWLGTSTGEITEWDLNTISLVRRYKALSSSVTHLIDDSERNRVYLASVEGITAVSTADGKKLFQADLGGDACKQLHSADSTAIHCITLDGTAIGVTRADGQVFKASNTELLGNEVPVRMMSRTNVRATGLSLGVYVGTDKCIYVSLPSKDQPTPANHKLNGLCGSFDNVAISPTGEHLAGWKTKEGKLSVFSL